MFLKVDFIDIFIVKFLDFVVELIIKEFVQKWIYSVVNDLYGLYELKQLLQKVIGIMELSFGVIYIENYVNYCRNIGYYISQRYCYKYECEMLGRQFDF